MIDLGHNPDSKFVPYQRMAAAIVDLARKNSGCLPEPKDLLPLGFTKEETAERWHMAHAMADVELKLTDKRSLPNSMWENCCV